jgi:GDSL-like lipase/acylhydrolase family protein
MSATRVAHWLIYGLFCLTFSVLALEGIIRISGLAAHLYTEPGFESSRAGDYWRYRPGFEGRMLGPTWVRIGPLGSRLDETSYEEKGDKLTVAFFGDSFTFGQGVAANLTFPALLRKELHRANLPVEVLNFGVQGHTLEMILAHLRDRGAEIHPNVVVLAFIGSDLDAERVQNRVDRFGYLTKNVFAPPSYWFDLIRGVARKSHLVLLVKDTMLRHKVVRRLSDFAIEEKLAHFRKAMEHFDAITADNKRLVVCLDLRESVLTRKIAEIMKSEFSHLTYVHAPQVLDKMPLETLRVPRDGHPNAKAHKMYAELLWPALIKEIQTQ